MKWPVFIIAMALLTFISGFCFGVHYQIHQEIDSFKTHYTSLTQRHKETFERQEQRIEWLSKELEGTRNLIFDELYRLKIDYLHYSRGRK